MRRFLYNLKDNLTKWHFLTVRHPMKLARDFLANNAASGAFAHW